MLPRGPAGLRPGVLVTLAALLCAVAVTVPAAGTGSTSVPVAGPAVPSDAKAPDPRRTRGLFVDPLMPAAQAARKQRVFAPIGRTPQALWITDYYQLDGVRSAVRDYSERANRADKTPMMAIYAIPDRDCGLYSSGGLPGGEEYRSWIREVAAGLEGAHAMVVLEPDAVPFMGDPRCQNAGDRLALLRYATRLLARAGAWVYLDAGHSGWRSPVHMAPLLKEAGIQYARGFSTNVGNFRGSSHERSYARALVAELRELDVRGLRYVTETARNGALAAPVDGDVCNPVWARIGRPPKLLFESGPDHGPLDGYLWIKHPGESDGQSGDDTCHGGPPSGDWWPKGAKRLLGKG